jgi:hypothetical protein
MAYTLHYTLYLRDGTKPQIGLTPADSRRFDDTEESSDSKRPSLEHVLHWIEVQAPKLRAAANEMRENRGTTTLYLEARLPIEIGLAGIPQHKSIGSDGAIPFANDHSLEELKRQVIAIYT